VISVLSNQGPDGTPFAGNQELINRFSTVAGPLGGVMACGATNAQCRSDRNSVTFAGQLAPALIHVVKTAMTASGTGLSGGIAETPSPGGVL